MWRYLFFQIDAWIKCFPLRFRKTMIIIVCSLSYISLNFFIRSNNLKSESLLLHENATGNLEFPFKIKRSKDSLKPFELELTKPLNDLNIFLRKLKLCA